MRSSHCCMKASGQLHGVPAVSHSWTLRPFKTEQTRLETSCTNDPVTRSAIPPEPSVSITNPAIITAPTGGWCGNSAQPAAGPSRRVVCIFKASSNSPAYWPHKKHSLFPSSVLMRRRRQNQDTGSHGFESGPKDQLWVSTVPLAHTTSGSWWTNAMSRAAGGIQSN